MFFLKSRTGRARNYTELKNSSSQKLKGILVNSGNPCVITVSKNEGQEDFTTVQAAVSTVLANNMNPVAINIKSGIFSQRRDQYHFGFVSTENLHFKDESLTFKAAETPQESAEEIKSYA